MSQNKGYSKRIFNIPVVVGALGYFVDIYDLLLFGIVRKRSLLDLGTLEADLLNVGGKLLDVQMLGLLLGGLLWGVLGDKKGRIKVLFGSILLYSIANILNGFATTVGQYAIFRFLAGVGLAGELGAAITLVSEVMPKETRGYGTAIVASIGICGAVAANLIGGLTTWRAAYWIGGGLGIALLILRISIYESGLYSGIEKHAHVRKGDLRMLFSPWPRFLTYLRCILVGVPIWFVIGILIIFAPEMAKAIGVSASITGGDAIMFAYMGLALGDLGSGLISQWVKSRKKVMFGFIVLTLACVLYYFYCPVILGRPPTGAEFYFNCGLLGFATGYWALMATSGSEQFGTNLRATAATTIPNFVRGSVVLVDSSFRYLKPSVGVISSALWVGSVCIVAALWAAYTIQESFGRDLEFLEL